MRSLGGTNISEVFWVIFSIILLCGCGFLSPCQYLHIICSINDLLPLHTCNGGLFMSNAAINYIAICEALAVSPSVVAAGVAADNVICALYFLLLFALASKIPAEAAKMSDGM